MAILVESWCEDCGVIIFVDEGLKVSQTCDKCTEVLKSYDEYCKQHPGFDP